jgi:hypothetical protein
MLVVDLCCGHGHVFEGWFASAEDLASQQARHLVTCPTCGDAQVSRRPSAAHVVTRSASAQRGGASQAPTRGSATEGSDVPPRAPGGSTPSPAAPATTSGGATLEEVQRLWLTAARELVARTEDVGERFAAEARAIHEGEAPARGIRGVATPEEREALRDEGIEVLSLPLPEGLTKPVH